MGIRFKVLATSLAVPLLAALSFGQAQRQPAADLIITNAKVWTVDKAVPAAQAVAVLGDRIVAVGSDADVDLWRGSQTRVVDAGGKLLVPGFNDAHVHFISGGSQLDNVQLNDATSAAEFTRRIGEYARSMPKGQVILGGDGDGNRVVVPWAWLRTPSSPRRTIRFFVSRYDGHMALANSVAMKLAGIDKSTPEVPGGTIVRDAQGNPTGALKDAAMGYLDKAVPALSHEQRVHAADRALALARSVGVTSVQDMNPDYADIAMYAELLERGQLTTRIYAAPPIALVEDQAKIGVRHAFGGPFRAWARWKVTRTAHLVRVPHISSSLSTISPAITVCCRTKCSRCHGCVGT